MEKNFSGVIFRLFTTQETIIMKNKKVFVSFETKYKGEIPAGTLNFELASDAASFILTQLDLTSKLC